MRPLKLEISALCSYSGRTVIDMEKLGESGIYLITGDTGAGKTTIFDAVTYALYGMPSGANREPSMLRSMYAPAHIPTYVKLVFSHKNKTYSIERNPAHSRAKKEGGKIANVGANAELYEISDSEEKNIASGTTRVNEAVIGILGIDHKQFCHIAMIAQGDFVKLLTAKSEERQRIFRKLFDTQLYDNAQNILKERESAAKKEYSALRDSIKQHLAGISCPENSPFFDELSAARENENAPDETVETAKKIIASDLEANTAAEQKISDIMAEISALSKAHGEAEKIITAKKKLESSEKLLAEKKSLLEELNSILEDKKSKATEAEELGQEIAELKATLPDYITLENERKKLADTNNNLENDRLALKKSSEKLAEIKAHAEQISTELKTLENAGEIHAELYLEKASAEARMHTAEELQTALAELEKLDSKRIKAEEKYILSRQNTAEAEDTYSRIRNAFLDAQAGIIAQTLEEGVPCRVCGSLSHPSPAAMPLDAPTQEQLDTAEEAMKEAHEKQNEASRLSAEIKEKYQSKKARTEELLNAIGADVEIRGGKMAAEAVLHECEQLITQLENRIAEEDRKTERRKMLLHDREISGSEEKSASEEISCLEKRLAAGEVQKNACISNISVFTEKLTYSCINEAENAITEKQDRKQSIENEIAKAKADYDNCAAQTTDLQGGIKTLSQILENSADTDTEKDYNELINSLETQRTILQHEKDEINARIAVNTEAVTKTEKLISKSAPLLRKCECLANLNDAVRGNITGQDKLSLEAYVQAVYFERIINFANLRLNIMTGGQYALRRKQTGSSKSAKCGLDLEITDYFNGTVRDVGSLSGGESFKASLALALGLADEIQSRAGGAKLDTMFIDEGFGSLDETSLDQAMEALAQLSGSNRLVGIISHVSELKRRIDKQIIVTKAKPAEGDEYFGTSVKIIV